jgi:hypothetical protein
MDFIPYVAATVIGAASVDIYKNNKNKKSQIDNNFNFSDFELEDAEVLTNKKIEEYTKINLSKK